MGIEPFDIEACAANLHDPARLEALKKSRQTSRVDRISFDRQAELAAKILRTPMSAISILCEEELLVCGGHGLVDSLATGRHIPIRDSICSFTLGADVISIPDVREHSLTCRLPLPEHWGLVAYLGVSVVTGQGDRLGTLCVVDNQPRNWSDQDRETLQGLAWGLAAEMELKILEEELDRERRLRECFVTTLSHDLRSPLAVITMSAHLMMEEEKNSEECREGAERIIRATMRADEMLKMILDDGQRRWKRPVEALEEGLDLVTLLKECVESLELTYGKRIRLSVPADPCVGRFAPQEISRAIENLVDNAIRYGSQSSIVNVSLSITARHEFAIGVHNHGPVISLERQRFLFSPFHRGDEAKRESFGLGLFIVRSVADAHGGRVKMQSDESNGTLFQLILPASGIH